MTYKMMDIQLYGVTADSSFTMSWMYPLYRKKERSKIANYRPITLLNTDYKTLTKALVIQVANVIYKMIHSNQNVFIPRRSIFDLI